MLSIVHPTDFSDLSNKALIHALRIALTAQCKLRLVHVAKSDQDHDEISFRYLRRILAQWGLVEPDASVTVLNGLGVSIENIRIENSDPAAGIGEFIETNQCDLIVLATHGRDGVEHWIKGSVAETVFKESSIPALFVPLSARGFVDRITGDLRLRRVLMPVDHSPTPVPAVHVAQWFSKMLTGGESALDILHIGHSEPQVVRAGWTDAHVPKVMVRPGRNVAEAIIDAATEFESDLICMATAGHHGLFDALRGSITERVLRHAPCPLLAVSVRQ